MLENENSSKDEGSLRSFCMSCKSSLRSMYSIGIPSYLSACSTSTSQDHSQKLANVEIVQLDSNALKTHSSNERSIYVSSKEPTEHLSKNANNLLSPLHVDDSNRENQANKARKIDNVAYKREHLKDRATITDDSRDAREQLILTDPYESRSNIQETRKPLEPAFNTPNLIKGLKETCDALSQINAKLRAIIALKENASRKNSISLKTTETDIVDRRRNIYNTAVRLSSKLSAYIRNARLLKKNLDGKKINEDLVKEASSKCKINATKSNNSPKDSPNMYTYNPLRAKQIEEIRKVMKKHLNGGKINKNFVKETSSKNKINATESNNRHNSPQDSLMYTYNPLRAKRDEEIRNEVMKKLPHF